MAQAVTAMIPLQVLTPPVLTPPRMVEELSGEIGKLAGLDRARITHAAQRMDGALDLYRVLPAVANIRGILFRPALVQIFLSSNPLSLARSAPARGDKIPPDVAWTLRCRDAKKYRSHAARCPHDNPVARTKVEEPRPSKASPRY